MEPHPATPPGRRRLRAIAGLLLVVLLAGCGLRLETPPPAEPEPDALEIVRRTAVSDALYVADQADAAVVQLDGRQPDLTAELERVAADSRLQAEQLGGTYDSGLEPTDPTTDPDTGSASGSATPSAAPVRPGDVVTALVDASGRSRTSADTTADGALARLLASVGAAQAVSAQRVGAYTDAGPPPTDPAVVPAPDGSVVASDGDDGEEADDAEEGESSGDAADTPGDAVSGLAALTADEASPTPAPTQETEAEVSSTGPDSDEPPPLPRGLTAAALSTLVESEDSAGYAMRLRAALRTGERRAELADLADLHTDRGDDWARVAGTDRTAQDPRQVAYAVPREADDDALVRVIEDDLATTYATLVGATAPETRSALIDLLVDAAVTTDAWGADPEPFPGLPEQESEETAAED